MNACRPVPVRRGYSASRCRNSRSLSSRWPDRGRATPPIVYAHSGKPCAKIGPLSLASIFRSWDPGFHLLDPLLRIRLSGSPGSISPTSSCSCSGSNLLEPEPQTFPRSICLCAEKSPYPPTASQSPKSCSLPLLAVPGPFLARVQRILPACASYETIGRPPGDKASHLLQLLFLVLSG